MNATSNGTHVSALQADESRHQQYRLVSSLLKEYTIVMYDIGKQIGNYLDTYTPSKSVLPLSMLIGLGRYKFIWRELGDVALFASQMIVHYQLDEAEIAELRLRLADAENSLRLVGMLSDLLHDHGHSEVLGGRVPAQELVELVDQIRANLIQMAV